MDITSVIETLCEKFGVAWGEAVKLVPQIVAWGRAKSAIGIAVAALVAVLCLFTIHRCFATMKKRRSLSNGTYDLLYYIARPGSDLTVYLATAVFAIFFDLLIASMFLSNWLQWFFAPNVAVINYVISLVQ